jgi:drug/metabolite transporter (DMT)-like permease
MKRVAWADLMLLSVILIWGLNFSIMKQLYTYFSPLGFTGPRFCVAVMTLAAILKIRGEPLRVNREDLPSIIGLGIVSTTIYQILFVFGLAQTKAGNVGLLMASTPVFAYLAGVLSKGEPFSTKVLSGIGLSVAGVAAIVLSSSKQVSFGVDWRGDAMILGSALCWGWYTGNAARLVVKYGALRLTLWVMLAGTAVLFPLVIPSMMRQDWLSIPLRGWLGFCYSTFLSIVYCYLAWSSGLRHLGVSRTALYSNLTPLIGLAGGWLMLGESPESSQVAGAALILIGVYIVRRGE